MPREKGDMVKGTGWDDGLVATLWVDQSAASLREATERML